MKPHHSRFIFHLVVALSLAVTFFMMVFLLAQNRHLGEQNQKLSEEIKAQTDINQRYLRCILLIEREKFATVETRVDAIDKCAVESRTPEGNPTGTQPTSEDQQNFEQPAPITKLDPVPQSGGTATNPQVASQPSTPTSDPSPESAAQPSSQPSLVERVTKPVTDLLGGLL